MNPEPVEQRGLSIPETSVLGAAGLVVLLPVFALAGVGGASSLSIGLAVMTALAVLTAAGYLTARP
ncbi:hypothetical protein [Halococcus hamelinensis]|uniref:Uncharacterized protein n=1 Tax=Halococcus hamelinensis 100A6 TaxID=1132509 RepID=M0MCB7_9EURY|nr:hypothetical protein [Halococcus hamelinensis]EMA42010.1 hypothetical protein C447_00430 [Halococcus hamelinensis 100A6]